jgi:hypothetical protein
MAAASWAGGAHVHVGFPQDQSFAQAWATWALIRLVLVLVAFVEGGSYVASQGKSAVDLMLSDLNVRPV